MIEVHFFFFLLTLAVANVEGKTLDNRLMGVPKVTCGPEKISIVGQSESEYEGTVFVKNWRRNEECVSAFTLDDNTTEPELSLPLGKISACGLEMRRNPESKELELFAVFVFSFHPAFVTAGDRAFAVHCVFQQRQLTVATNVDFISDITTKAVLGATSSVPTVTLEIVLGRIPDLRLENAQHVSVGQPLMLVWHLNALSEIYGLRIMSCTAESRTGQKIIMLLHGCSKDLQLVLVSKLVEIWLIQISDVRYSDDRQRAFADAQAFKFADVDDVWFKCATKLCIRRFEHLQVADDKDHSELCDEEPKCPAARPKRSIDDDGEEQALLAAVDSDPETIFVTGRLNVKDEYANYYQSEAYTSEENNNGFGDTLNSILHHQSCLSHGAYIAGATVIGSAYITLLLALALVIFLKAKNSK